MNPIEICGICKMNINTTKDNFVHLEDYKTGIFLCEGFYHNKCYGDSIKGGEDMKKMKKMTFGLLKKAQSIVGVEDDKPDKIYNI